MKMQRIMGTCFLLLIFGAFASLAAMAQDATPEVTPEATADAPCVVRTDRAGRVSVRVGPGMNRTSFVFLPVDEDFEVLGKAEDDDGGLWWKLDREIVAPK